MPETAVYRHNPPRDLAVTLTWARGPLILILLVWALRQYFSIRTGLAEHDILKHSEEYTTDLSCNVFDYVYWPVGMMVVCLGLLASSVTRFVLDRRAIAAMQGWAGATVADDVLELRLIGCLATRTVRTSWDEVIGACLSGRGLREAHVIIRATKRRRCRLPPYMEDPEGFIGEVLSRAKGVSTT